MKKKTVFISLVLVILIIALFSPKLIKYWSDKNYNANHTVSIFLIMEFTILEKHVKDDSYFLKFTIDGDDYHRYYKVRNQVKDYSLGDNKELFDRIDIKNQDSYAGITLKSEIPLKELTIEETNFLKTDPMNVITNDKYNKYITIIDVK